jgi:hypothetical protein
MLVRIRFATGPKIVRKRGKNRRLAAAASVLLTPGAALAAALAMWRVAADLSLAKSFAISTGLFSHWQVWAAAAILLQMCSRMLNRYGRGGDTATS